MKKKSIIILISSVIIIGVIVASILLIKPKAESMNTDTVVEENVSDEIVIDENVTEEDKEDIEEVVIKEDVNDPLSQDNIIQLDDGTYDFTDEFLGTVMTYDYFVGSTEAEVKQYLNEAMSILINESTETRHLILQYLHLNGSTLKSDNEKRAEFEQQQQQDQNQQTEQQEQKEQQNTSTEKPSTGNNSNTTTQTQPPSQPSGPTGSTNSDDWHFDNLPPGWEVGGDFGGGEHTELPEGFQGIF